MSTSFTSSSIVMFNSLGLRPNIRNKLKQKGYHEAKDIISAGPVRLAKELNISTKESLQLVRQIEKSFETKESTDSRGSAPSRVESNTPPTAFDLLERQKHEYVVSFCRDLDRRLGGGIPTMAVTELFGEPGVGKTQFCMQLAADVQVPPECGGLGGSAIFIDTEGSFMPERMHQIAEGLVRHMHMSAKQHENVDERLSATTRLTADRILSKIWCFRVHDHTEQICTIKRLGHFIREHKEDNIKLIVIDSVSFHFRRDFTNMGKRSRVLSDMSQTLHGLARDFGLAVVMTNQMTTRFLKSSNRIYPPRTSAESSSRYSNAPRGGTTLVPALGESWSHSSTVRIRLRRLDGDVRKAELVKSPSHAPGGAYYRVTSSGIRGVASVRTERKRSSPCPGVSESKRSRREEATDARPPASHPVG